MKLRRICTCTLPCKEIFSARKVVLFSYIDEHNQEQWAEAAPLPGRSRETCDDVIQILKSLKQSESLPLTFPSLQFAFDAPHLPSMNHPMEICRLLTGSAEEILKKAEQLYLQGTKSVKVKVSNFSIREAVALVKDLQQIFLIRVDANRKWELQDAHTFCSHFTENEIEFFEEPLRNTSELRSFPLPFALDESLVESPQLLEPLLQLPNLHTLVIKPSVLGGKKACLEWIALCQRQNLRWVFSSSFESGIGILQLARLMSVLPSCGTPPGIDTYSYLAQDLLMTPLEIRGGTLIPPTTIAVREDMLCPI